MLKYRMARFGTAIMLLITMWFTMSVITVHAHFQTIAYSEISIQDKTINYALFLDPYELVQVFPDLDANSDMYVDAEDVLNFQEQLFGYVQTNLTAKNEGVVSEAQLKEVKLEDRETMPMVRFDLIYTFAKPVSSYELDYRFFFDKEDPMHQNFVTMNSGERNVETVIDKDHHILTPEVFDMNTITVAIPDWTSTLLQYVGLGMEHIWSGIDHILFLVALIIGGGSKKDYLKILTAFTIGHSITLSLSVMEVVTVPPEIIEPLIALSIVYVAVENIVWKRLQWRWLVTLVFGLIHGFGFSYILQGMLTSHFALSLFSFNLGVELGQIVVLAVLLPLVWYLTKMKWLLKTSYGVSGIVGVVGLYWFMERIF